MKCYHPVDAYRTEHGITFNRNERGILHHLHIPCGQCIGCRERIGAQWAIRLQHEASLWDANCFVTLTYSEGNLPPGGTLLHRDFALFMKRLRKANGPNVRFFMCGEYGPKTLRPHYHACLFNIDFRDREPAGKSKGGFPFFYSKHLSSLWELGRATVQNFTPETAAYTTGYILKKAKGQEADVRYLRQNPDGTTYRVAPEYAQMSRRPGIGYNWITRFHRDIFPHDTAVSRTGRELPVPRYYTEKAGDLYDLDEIKYQRELRARQYAADNTPERLAVQETVHKARNRNKHRNFDHDAP